MLVSVGLSNPGGSGTLSSKPQRFPEALILQSSRHPILLTAPVSEGQLCRFVAAECSSKEPPEAAHCKSVCQEGALWGKWN